MRPDICGLLPRVQSLTDTGIPPPHLLYPLYPQYSTVHYSTVLHCTAHHSPVLYWPVAVYSTILQCTVHDSAVLSWPSTGPSVWMQNSCGQSGLIYIPQVLLVTTLITGSLYILQCTVDSVKLTVYSAVYSVQAALICSSLCPYSVHSILHPVFHPPKVLPSLTLH